MQIQVDECDVERNSSDSNCMDTNSLIDEINESCNQSHFSHVNDSINQSHQSYKDTGDDSIDNINIELLEPISTQLLQPQSI